MNTTGFLLQWTSPQINTSGGVLVFQDASQIPGTFEAILGQSPTGIPTMTEWGMIIFMVLAGLGAVLYLTRRKRAKS